MDRAYLDKVALGIVYQAVRDANSNAEDDEPIDWLLTTGVAWWETMGYDPRNILAWVHRPDRTKKPLQRFPRKRNT